MNVGKFFKFIGDKRPEYKLSSSNQEFIKSLKRSFEETINNQDDIEGSKELLPLPVDGKGYIDDDGKKQGLFLVMVGHFRLADEDSPYGDYMDFESMYTTYKDNMKDGIETFYKNDKLDSIFMTIEYKNGKKNGKQILYKDGSIPYEESYYRDDVLQ